jgi:CheY-like chemotaxis protein
MWPYQAVLRLTLTKMKCTVDIAEDGAQAVAAVKASLTSDRPYSLVLMDLRMPVMDGFEAGAYTRPLLGSK